MIAWVWRGFREHTVEFLFGGLVFVIYAYFYNGVGWNQNARLDSIYAFVEPGPHAWSFRIDGFLPRPEANFNTGDWAQAGEHYYSNKAPGTALFGLLAYAPLYWLERLVGIDAAAFAPAHINAYLLNLWISVLPCALCAAFLLRVHLRDLPKHKRGALDVMFALFFGTLLFPYSSQIWGHTPSAVCALTGLVCCTDAGGTRRRFVVCGALFGAAVLMDFLAAASALFCVSYVAFKRRSQLGAVLLGGAPFAALLLLYNALCFGSPFALAPSLSNPMFIDEGNLGGLFGRLSWQSLGALLISWKVGLLTFSPLFLFSGLGAAALWRKGHRDEVLLCLGAFVATWGVIACFNGWHGGDAVGGRYMIAALPALGFLLRGMVYAPQWGNYWFRRVTLISVANMFVVAAVTTRLRGHYEKPLITVYQWLFSEQLGYRYAPVRLFENLTDSQWALTKFNLGQLAGLGALGSVALPMMALALGIWGLRVMLSREDRAERGDPKDRSDLITRHGRKIL